MGRNKKYNTVEERKEAQKKWQADHYERNKKEILKKARERYRAKKIEKAKRDRMKKLYDE
jgi:hypothetical protein